MSCETQRQQNLRGENVELKERNANTRDGYSLKPPCPRGWVASTRAGGQKIFFRQKEHRSNIPMDRNYLKVTNRDESCKCH